MKKNTINAIQIAQESGLIIPFCSDVKKAKGTVPKKQGQVIGIWASRYDKSLIDALIDLYQPLEALFKEIDGKCEGCFLFVNTETESILCMYLGLYNRLHMLQLGAEVKSIERGSSDWKKFIKIDRHNALNSFSEALEEFGTCARRSNELPALAENIDMILAENPNQKIFCEYGVEYTREEMEDACDEAEMVENQGNRFLSVIKQSFPNIGWGDLNNQDAW